MSPPLYLLPAVHDASVSKAEDQHTQAKRREKMTDVWCPPLWRILEWSSAAWADEIRLESDFRHF